ncbi:MAG: hypothetical protein ACRDGV_12935 [Candidatus Limnocylindria bacterium]
MIAVAVRGYGIVIWREADSWRTYGRSDALAATLSARVEAAFGAIDPDAQATVRGALLSITGAHLLADDGADGELGRDN